MLTDWIYSFSLLKKLNTLVLIWTVAGIAFLMFTLHKIHMMAVIDTAQCLFHKEREGYKGFLTHIVQHIYRILFENCDHDYR